MDKTELFLNELYKKLYDKKKINCQEAYNQVYHLDFSESLDLAKVSVCGNSIAILAIFSPEFDVRLAALKNITFKSDSFKKSFIKKFYYFNDLISSKKEDVLKDIRSSLIVVQA